VTPEATCFPIYEYRAGSNWEVSTPPYKKGGFTTISVVCCAGPPVRLHATAHDVRIRAEHLNASISGRAQLLQRWMTQ
jgi:hypothetical protein